MTAYVDELKVRNRTGAWPYDKSCHLTADTVDELHDLARSIRLKREWYQPHPYPHYDLTAAKRLLALREGAVEEWSRDAMRRMK